MIDCKMTLEEKLDNLLDGLSVVQHTIAALITRVSRIKEEHAATIGAVPNCRTYDVMTAISIASGLCVGVNDLMRSKGRSSQCHLSIIDEETRRPTIAWRGSIVWPSDNKYFVAVTVIVEKLKNDSNEFFISAEFSAKSAYLTHKEIPSIITSPSSTDIYKCLENMINKINSPMVPK
jgi:hypothetical protein